MFRDILTNRLFLAGLVFFVLIVSGSLFYSWHVRRTTEAEFAQTDVFLQHLENKKDAGVNQSFEPMDTDPLVSSEMPMISEDTQPMPEKKEALPPHNTDNVEMVDALLPSDVIDTEAERTDVPVSPFGFGPYPEIPVGFPEPDIFDSLASMADSDMRKALELQKRLIVEFWKQGKSLENVGVTGDTDGKIYLLYPDVVYVRWDYWTDEDGATHKYAGVTRGHPDTAHLYESYLDKGEIPPGITVYELPDGYIDAYEFLGLSR